MVSSCMVLYVFLSSESAWSLESAGKSEWLSGRIKGRGFCGTNLQIKEAQVKVHHRLESV